jgi:dynein intermediate chain 2
MYDTQLCYWDSRKSTKAIDTSPIENSHRDPVYDICWLQSKTGSECASCSTDGSTYWWDIRRMGEPVDTLTLQEKNSNVTLGAVCMEYEPAAGPTKLMVGTEQGTVLLCNRKAKNPADRVAVRVTRPFPFLSSSGRLGSFVLTARVLPRTNAPALPKSGGVSARLEPLTPPAAVGSPQAAYVGHHGPVYALQRNPFFPKYFLSIGDWTARVWMEDIKTPVMTTKYHDTYLMGGVWSPTRPGVFSSIKVRDCSCTRLLPSPPRRRRLSTGPHIRVVVGGSNDSIPKHATAQMKHESSPPGSFPSALNRSSPITLSIETCHPPSE